ncbi:MAG TPA: polyprenyl synthetase family protein [Candidatus Nanoarchaeia archaeon]|nr:polyprenyl synthetase family protein [Candidatus Nanoarchaeia archaeon]
MNLEQFRSYFDSAFFPFLQQKIAIFLKESSSSEIKELMEHVEKIAHGGKRFRPYLTYLALNKHDPDTHLELFFSIELLQIFALVHDDIMDHGKTRHGVECIHVSLEKKYGDKRIAEGVAILAGDLLHQWSQETILSYTEKHSDHREIVLGIFGELVREVIHGQMLDMISPTQETAQEDLIIQKMYLKTAKYSFIQPMRIGFAARGAMPQEHEFAETYGRALGIAFQLQDDLIDVIGGHNKSLFLDIETKQHTLLYWYMQHKATAELFKQFEPLLGKTLNEDEKKNVTRLLRESGAFEYVERRIEEYLTQALIVTNDPIWKDVAHTVLRHTIKS